jgi:hypothetical protein
MRRFISGNAQVFQRLDSLELKRLQTEDKISTMLTAIVDKTVRPKLDVFYDGQVLTLGSMFPVLSALLQTIPLFR